MKIRYLLLTTFLLFLLVACNGDDSAEPTATSAPAATAAPATDTPGDTGYPAPATADPDAYPPPPTAIPADGGYPEPSVGEQTWILHPAGEQCSDVRIYADLTSAISELQLAGIEVYEAEEVSLAVCEACGCPTSEHYRLQIGIEDLSLAEQNDWTEE